MGGYLCKDTKVFKAKNFHQQSLDDKSFSVLNVHGASGMGGALLVILILLLATPGYSLASAESGPHQPGDSQAELPRLTPEGPAWH